MNSSSHSTAPSFATRIEVSDFLKVRYVEWRASRWTVGTQVKSTSTSRREPTRGLARNFINPIDLQEETAEGFGCGGWI